jgi:hypothetical protein
VNGTLVNRPSVIAKLFDWIWHVKGSLPLRAEQSSDEAFARLDPLFRQPGTSHERIGDTLTFRKKDQAAQDKMSVFDDGVLRITHDARGSVLHYRMSSRILLFCFLAPLLFVGFGQLTIAIGKLEGPSTQAADKKKPDEKKVLPQSWIDKALGAPAPEMPKKDTAAEKKEDKKHSPTTAYVFAGIFAALYVVGRILEDRLIRGLFRKSLFGPAPLRTPVWRARWGAAKVR